MSRLQVDLGLLMELCGRPSAEIITFKAVCEDYPEKYHDNIEWWYLDDGDEELQQYLCKEAP